MRMTQFVGLRPEATEFLDKNAEQQIAETCPHCHQPTRHKPSREVYTKTDGMFGEEIPLHEYALRNGETWREIVQAEPWSSGPVIFLCLEDEMKKLHFKWPKKDIDNC